MRKWGIVISALYALIVLGLLLPALGLLAESFGPADFFEHLKNGYKLPVSWMLVAAVVSGQVILLFLSVDTSFKRSRPRAHVAFTCIVASMFFALLAFAAIYSLAVAVPNDSFLDKLPTDMAPAMGFGAILWLLWGVFFYIYVRNSSAVVTRAISWLLRGSVLELLIAVPCHVIVRRRGDCSAPILTSYGIVTGISLMLLSFGPSVLLLYKKRLDGYSTRNAK